VTTLPDVDGRFMLDVTAELCRIPSPTGFTKAAVDRVTTWLEAERLTVTRTVKGSLVAAFPGNAGRTGGGRLLSAHVDTLGAVVKEIKPNGRLRLSRIGGYDWSTIEGEYCLVHTRSGASHTGTILTTKSSTHIFGQELAELKRDDKSIEVRLDFDTGSIAETKAAGISVGDFVSFDPRAIVTDSGYIKSRHLDDKACVAILVGVARALKACPAALTRPAYLYVSTYEEVGHGTSAGIPGGVTDVIAVDMAAVGETQTSDEKAVTVCMKDGSGPYDYELSKSLIDLCEANELDYRVDVYTYYASDVSQALRAGYDVRGALVGPGVDGSHSFERLHQASLEETAKLLTAYLISE
jgi:putative aminopeptidase FrvX